MWSKADKVTAEWEKKIPNYHIGEKATSSKDLYNYIDTQLTDYETVSVALKIDIFNLKKIRTPKTNGNIGISCTLLHSPCCELKSILT